jgi:uridine phosphorylase
MQLADSELIINPDGSIYHLNILPEDVAKTIIFVGDPERVGAVSKHFDTIDIKKQKREFVTHTGTLRGKRMTVISTGISTDNIDIVLNELDALVNIDLKTRRVKKKLTQLDIVRIGTSGSMQKDVKVDDLLVSSFGVGMDVLLNFYNFKSGKKAQKIQAGFEKLLDSHLNAMVTPYVFKADKKLLNKVGKGMKKGITLTCPGFYAPQGRQLRASSQLDIKFTKAVAKLTFGKDRFTNFEMETAGIYGLAAVLGHRALSCNAILANRITNEFSQKPKKTVEKLITTVLEKLTI